MENIEEIREQEQNIEEKVQNLLGEMTLREKLGQCVMIEPLFCLEEKNTEGDEPIYNDELDPEFLALLLKEYNIGFFLFGGVSRIGDGSPKAWANYIARVNEYLDEETRLKIPVLFGIDAVHGVNFMKGSTIFSHNLGLTSTWNPELAKEYAEIVGKELSTIGFNTNFAPTIDVARDQRWGRVYESLGEDPFLASAMSGELISGMQNSGNLAASAKHFIGYGESSNGMDRTPADLSDRNILEMHIPPFEAAIKKDVYTIMINGGDVNGIPMPASKRLITGMLKERLGYKGVTLSDWEDVDRLRTRHKVALDRRNAIGRAFNAGVDVNMAVADLKAVDVMEELVNEGKISMERVDEAASNVLRVKFKLDLFDKKPLNVDSADSLVGNVKSKEIAKQVALESITLLKNENKLLPLSKNYKSVLITGKSANSKSNLCGGWTLGWAGAKEEDLNCSTILESIKGKLSSDTKVYYATSAKKVKKLVKSGKEFDVCISIVGEKPHAEWLGDSMGMSIEKDEKKLLKAAHKTGSPVVMVSLIGRPQNVVWGTAKIPAILWAYLPGTEGAEPIADVLFGDYNPSGRLPVTFPKNANQIPIVYNARRYESSEISTKYDPLYPFGHGLSYSEFKYSELTLPRKVKIGTGVDISVKVKNISMIDGAEVVQLFLKDMYASVTRPLRSLKGFKKVFLKAGEEKEVTIRLTPRELSLYNEDLEFVEEPRVIEVQINNLSKRFGLIE